MGKRGGKQPGAGRPPGKKTQAVLDRDAALKLYRERVVGLTDVLLNSQLTLARGQTFLYKIEKEVFKNKKGEVTKIQRKKPVLVTDQWEIESYLEGKLEEGDFEDPEATYYYLTSKEPDSRAIDSMMDRTYGKSVQSVKAVDEDGNAVPIIGITVQPLDDIK